MAKKTKSRSTTKVGFARLTKAQRQEMARKGGKARPRAARKANRG